jgi:hypothetical protein
MPLASVPPIPGRVLPVRYGEYRVEGEGAVEAAFEVGLIPVPVTHFEDEVVVVPDLE